VKERLKKEVGKSFQVLVLLGGVFDLLLQWFFRHIGVGIVNNGVSFGAFSGVNLIFLFVIWTGLWWLWMGRGKSRGEGLSIWLMIVGGGVNIISRLFFGGVWDYLKIPILGLWVNFSDIMITSGVILYIFKK